MIATIHLFDVLDEKLIRLLKSLKEDDWNKAATPKWTVKDVAAHLLDGNIRMLSMLRDGYFGMGKPASSQYDDVLEFINDGNAQWVEAAKRFSPVLLIELLEITGKAHNAYYTSLPMHATAVFSVGWAGEKQSKNWFHIAREYTEKWHHQQQIRKVVGREKELYSEKFYRPYLETSMHAFPYHYRNVLADDGEAIHIHISGEGGGHWFLVREKGWHLTMHQPPKIAAKISIPGELAWQLFTKAVPPEKARKHVDVSGPAELTEPVFTLLAVMA